MKTNIRVGLKKKRVGSPNVWVSPMMLLKENWSNSYWDSTLFFSISFFIVKCALIFVIIIIIFYKAWHQACFDLSFQLIMWRLNKSLIK